MPFTKNVFINCPFDNEYFPILRPILFTLIYLGFNPKISETSDSGATRLNTIKNLIRESKYSIHDISRVELTDRGLPRFNMPLECGMDFGAKLIGGKKLSTKSFLILEKERFRYQEFMSDIAGNDIRAHSNDPEKAIKQVRDWLKISTQTQLDYSKQIWLIYNEFLFDYEQYSAENHFNPHDMHEITFSDLIELMRAWISGWYESSSVSKKG